MTERALSSRLLHDLKTPLTAIDGYAGLVLRGASEKHASYLEGILASSYLLRHFIDNLAAPERDDGSGEISEILARVSKNLARLFQAKHAVITVASEEIPLSRGSRLTERLVVNLLALALPSSDPEASIHLSASASSGTIELMIAAQGLAGETHLIEPIVACLGGEIRREPEIFKILLPTKAFS